MSWFSLFAFFSPSTAARKQLNLRIRHDMVFAAFLYKNITVPVADRRVRTTLHSSQAGVWTLHYKSEESLWQKRHLWRVPRLSQSLYGVLSACIRSSSHTPVCFAQGPQAASQEEGGRRTEGGGGGRWQSIHQASSESSVWARWEGRRAGTELPKPPFISPDVIISLLSALCAPASFQNALLRAAAPMQNARRGGWFLFLRGVTDFTFLENNKENATKGQRSRCEILHGLFLMSYILLGEL